jgi:16S rRNA (uracil1498-N3)-methyltransferase
MNNQEIHNLFYTPPEEISKKTIMVQGTEFHHIKNVLRKKQGEILQFTDGAGGSYRTVITGISRTSITVDVIEKTHFERTVKSAVDIAFVPVKGNRNDFVIEKCTELGVRKFILFLCENSVVKDLSNARVSRYKKIALSAMLQSMQYYLPEIAATKNIINSFKDYNAVVVADAKGPQEAPLEGSAILFMVGPEGGFTAEEIKRYTENGARLFSLGRNRLRSETAAIAGIAKTLTATRQI